jgi:hypothetical protein
MTITVAIIASLCFSVGEGLRLTPFPISTLSLSNSGLELRNRLIVASGVSLQDYGPINVSSHAQTLKRGKRHTLDCDFPPFPNTNRLPGNDTNSHIAEESLRLVSPLQVSQLADRAPPFTA